MPTARKRSTRRTAQEKEHHAPPPGLDEELERIAGQCRRIVHRRALISASAAVVPLPGIDLAVDLGVLMQLLEEINAAFGLAPSQLEGLPRERRLHVYRAIALLGSTTVGRVITRELLLGLLKRMAQRVAAKTVLKYVPLAGQAAAAGISYAAIRLVGAQHIAACVAVRRQMARPESVAPDGAS
jgi:uncharacterized protein (DUF697 family)